MSSEPSPLAAAPASLAHPAAEEDARTGTPSRRQRWLLQSVWLPHALFILYLIAAYAVNLPTIDQWDGELPFLEKVVNGTAGLSDLIAPHLEHRVATNRVIGWLVAELFDWNQKVECAFAWLFACGCAVNLVVLSCRQPGIGMASRVVQLTVASALFFSVTQYANWINCFGGLQWFSVEWYFLTGLVVAGTPWASAYRYAICIALALAATYSSSNGLLAWLLLLPALLAPFSRRNLHAQRRFIGVWAAATALAVFGYFAGYQRSDGAESLISRSLDDPGRLVLFFFANVGSPFSRAIGADTISIIATIGALIAGVALAACAYVLWQRRDARLVGLALPWIAIVAYGMATGMAMTLGRTSTGLKEAIASRYVTTHLLSVVALVFLVPIVLRHMLAARGRPPAGRRTVVCAWIDERRAATVTASLTTAVMILHLDFSIAMFPLYSFYKTMFLRTKAAVLFVETVPDESLLKWAWTKTSPEMARRARFLEQQGYLQPELIHSVRVADFLPSREQALGGIGEYGTIEQAAQPGPSTLVLSGWAILPRRAEPAHAVLLSWVTEPKNATIFH